ncbi:MAG TPA: NAD(P)H-dependent oxidoreductase [Kiritimatiellia bacterium]|nr:NAD(P)H-dependent oxidoreductase [Kiritimatiellia bacterium]
MESQKWHRLGPVGQFTAKTIQQIKVDNVAIALTYRNGEFAAISGLCGHVGGPLGDGTVNAEDYVVCPWHGWQFHRVTGAARPGIPAAVPRHDVKVENGDLFVNLTPASSRIQPSRPAHPLTREIKREPGPLRVVGISTTVMNKELPRYSTSEDLLQVALDHASAQGAETKLIRLNDLAFRNCEGYYSKSAHACTWPCTITQMDQSDELDKVYEALVFWADVVLVSTSIRWGSASSLYFKMIERLNCVQNQITIHDCVLIRNKVAGFVITGGQDNIQAVAGQMMLFFGEIGFTFPQFPFIAHSRGWSAEDMENNMTHVQGDRDLRDGSKALIDRCLKLAEGLIACGEGTTTIDRGGRKAHRPK